MKNTLSILLIILSLFSCNDRKDDLKMVVINSEVVCIENLDFNNNKNYNNKLYDSLSLNILNYTLTNNSNKKYFIVLNENFVDVMENDFLLQKLVKNRIGTRTGLSFNLYKNDSLINGRTTLLAYIATYQSELELCNSKLYRQNYIDSLFIENVKKRKLYTTKDPSVLFRDVLDNTFVIYPKETKYFTSVVNLPLRNENTNWISNIFETKPNFASFTLVNIAKETKLMLSRNQRKEIEENEYEIFDGVIESNKVPVKMISIPD